MATAPTRHPVHHVLHRPLLFCGVERWLFVVAASGGLLTWDTTHNFLTGAVIFAALYAGAWIATSRDPQLLHILVKVFMSPLRRGVHLRAAFDPLTQVPVRLKVRR